MSTLILYDTKKGFTKGCAQRINSQVPDSDIFEIDSEKFELKDYDTVLIGAPIYTGKIEKTVIKFIEQKKPKLMDKKLGFFCAGMNKEEFLSAIQKSLPAEIFYRAQTVHCGGEIDFPKLSLLQKVTVKRRLGIKDSVVLNKEDDVEEFIKWVNSNSKEKTR